MKKFIICFKTILLNKTALLAGFMVFALTVLSVFALIQMGSDTDLLTDGVIYIALTAVAVMVQLVCVYAGASLFMSVSDNRDEDIIYGLNTTPLSGQRYILYQALSVYLVALLMGGIILTTGIIMFPLENTSVIPQLYLALILMTSMVPIATFIGAIVTNDKIGAFAFVKIGLLFLLANIIPMFLALFEVEIAKSIEWLFYILPGTLPNMYYFSLISDGMNATPSILLSTSIYLVLGVVVTFVEIYLLYKLTSKKLAN